eukprot:TRINITY_DN14680_c0_g1_i1.p1 TRINITY_DN14680_c0_g1~~TRINITY_DN14680_c0_g1_i1.p1  ORF type:complete len:462 (-),score=96.01 TRINITY_DN14680_c0_g1_i1:71-1456(-)
MARLLPATLLAMLAGAMLQCLPRSIAFFSGRPRVAGRANPKAPDGADSSKNDLLGAKNAEAVATSAEAVATNAEAVASEGEEAIAASDSASRILANFAADARNIAAEAGKEAAKPGEASAAARAKELLFDALASGLDAASKAPELAAGAAATLLALVVAISALSGGNKQAETASVRQAPPAQVVVVENVEKPKLPQSLPSKVQTAPATNLSPVPAGRSDADWARSLANSGASTLRKVADGLPAAERALESELPQALPNIERGLKWASEVTPENAPEKLRGDVLPAAGKVAEQTVRLGLRLGAGGLDLAADNLPAAGAALQSLAVKGVPLAQSALSAAADGSRALADKAAEVAASESSTIENPTLRSLVGAAPQLLKGTASGLDTLSSAAPQIESVAAYAGEKILEPLLQATLKAGAVLADSASDAPAPNIKAEDIEKAANSLKSGAESLASAAASVKMPSK